MAHEKRSAWTSIVTGSVGFFLPALGLISAAHAGTMVTTPELRQAAMQSCTGDVLRLCPTVLFDEQKIFDCMKANRAQLTPRCGAVFDKGTRTVRR